MLVGCFANDTRRFLRAMDKSKPTLRRWLPYASELGQDEQLYDRHPDYLYPPFFLTLLRPLTLVSPTAAAVLWQLGKYVALVGTFMLAWSLLARAGPLPLVVKVASVIMSLRFITSDIGHGNVNLFIAFLVVLAAWFLSRGRPVSCGLTVAIAACIKVTPALWAVYLLYKRQWRATLGVLIGAALALEVVPLAVVSPSMNHALLGRWYTRVVHDYAAGGHVYSTRMNQSLVAVSNRLLGRSDLAPVEESVSMVALSPGTIVWIQRAISLVFIALLAWSCRGLLPKSDPIAFAAEWSLVAAVTLALSGYTWTGHYCLLILAHVVAPAYLVQRGSTRFDRPVLILLFASFALMSLTGDLLTPTGRERASSIGLVFFGMLTLATCLWLIRERRHMSQA